MSKVENETPIAIKQLSLTEFNRTTGQIHISLTYVDYVWLWWLCHLPLGTLTLFFVFVLIWHFVHPWCKIEKTIHKTKKKLKTHDWTHWKFSVAAHGFVCLFLKIGLKSRTWPLAINCEEQLPASTQFYTRLASIYICICIKSQIIICFSVLLFFIFFLCKFISILTLCLFAYVFVCLVGRSIGWLVGFLVVYLIVCVRARNVCFISLTFSCTRLL